MSSPGTRATEDDDDEPRSGLIPDRPTNGMAAAPCAKSVAKGSESAAAHAGKPPKPPAEDTMVWSRRSSAQPMTSTHARRRLLGSTRPRSCPLGPRSDCTTHSSPPTSPSRYPKLQPPRCPHSHHGNWSCHGRPKTPWSRAVEVFQTYGA
jgi:hypothetical protein